MADPTTSRDTGTAGNDTGTPRWVKVFGIIALVVVLLFLILLFARGPGGRHGPARHMGLASPEEAYAAIAAVERPRKA